MNKKFLSAILFGALMVSSTGTFVSCKDYDDDIDAINKELTDIKSQLAALQTEVDGGNWVTELVDVEGGFKVTFSNGKTYTIVNGKDGAQGEPGTPGKDGNGTIVEVKDGYWYLDGKKTEYVAVKKEFYNINNSIYSDIQNIWDRYRKETKMNLIVCGSIYSLMNKIFQNNKEPLFGRADNIIKLSPFSLPVLKEIMYDYYPTYTNDDLLALYTFTGGIPKYVELFCDNRILNINGMIDFMVRDNSPFTDEGKNLLIEEFGKNYATYFSILSAIANGKNTQAEIEAALGNKSIGGYLRRLIEDYNIIVRQRPILSKEGTLAIRYEIQDNFISFWFNYFDKNRSLIEIKNYMALRSIIKADYPTYSGKMLERYFKQKFAESFLYKDIGSWWELKGDAYEIDIVALCLEKDKAVAVEIKRQKKNYKPDLLEKKVEHLKHKVLPHYAITKMCLSLEDM
jgi:uncharacterized protein